LKAPNARPAPIRIMAYRPTPVEAPSAAEADELGCA
jgi:hypothetical protein